MITATMESTSKFDLEFWDTDLDESEKEPGSGIQLLASVEHYGMTEIQWDPSGRYVATLGSIWVNSVSHLHLLFKFSFNSFLI